MKKFCKVAVICLLCLLIFSSRSGAQIPILDIIKAGVKKVIKAVDLKIQRLQNETIWLQNAQKVMENTMSDLKLNEIGSWVDKQKTLYSDYFDELSKVKAVIAYYQRIRDITNKQSNLISAYQHSWNLIKNDKHFNARELDYMASVYVGILDESAKNMDQILLVINSLATQMTDAKRLEIINHAADRVDKNYSDLKEFNAENAMLSLQRAKEDFDIATTRALYGIQ